MNLVVLDTHYDLSRAQMFVLRLFCFLEPPLSSQSPQPDFQMIYEAPSNAHE